MIYHLTAGLYAANAVLWTPQSLWVAVGCVAVMVFVEKLKAWAE